MATKTTRQSQSSNGARPLPLLPAWVAILVLLIISPASQAWDVGVLFLGAKEPTEYHQDVANNLEELQRLQLAPRDQVSIFYEAPTDDRIWSSMTREWILQPRSPKTRPLIHRALDLQAFFSKAFARPDEPRMLVIYGHGLGFEGLKEMDLISLSSQLKKVLPGVLDILWMDSCFMGNLEAAYELRGLTKYYVSSQESEFSSGLPFESLARAFRMAPRDPLKVSMLLAESFLDSYSFLRNGSQTAAVESSAATISVIDTSKLDGFIDQISSLAKALNPMPLTLRARLTQKVTRIRMDEPTLLDLGALLIQMRSLSEWLPSGAPQPLTDLLKTLELLPGRRLQTQPRVWLEPPTQDSYLVFGFDRWSRGHKQDSETLAKLPSPLLATNFIYGRNQLDWPLQAWPEAQRLTPFTVGFSSFHYYFVNAQGLQISPEEHLHRRRDRNFFVSTQTSSPIRAAGYTQSVGKKSEKYTGVTISDPTRGLPSLNYPDLQMVLKTGWGNF